MSYSNSSSSFVHPCSYAGAISESLQNELDIILATTNAAEDVAFRNAEVRCAATSAAYKQMQIYRRKRKELLQRLIKEKKEYIEILKKKIQELDDDEYSYTYSYISETE